MVVHKNIHHHHFHPNERSMMQMSQNFRSEDAMVKSSHNMITRGTQPFQHDYDQSIIGYFTVNS